MVLGMDPGPCPGQGVCHHTWISQMHFLSSWFCFLETGSHLDQGGLTHCVWTDKECWDWDISREHSLGTSPHSLFIARP